MSLPLYIKRGFIGCTSAWSTLGFYRGVKEYNYENKIDMDSYNIDKEKYGDTKYILIKPTYFYITSISYGFYGSIAYIFPLTAPICFMKEVYRIEINLRNISDEKKTKYYNTVY
jgi:hypothetical protein